MRVVLVSLLSPSHLLPLLLLLWQCVCALPQLTLCTVQTSPRLPLSSPPSHPLWTTTNSHQTRLFLPYNQRDQREKFARFMHAWSTRTGVCVCVCLCLPPDPIPLSIAFQSPQLCVLPPCLPGPLSPRYLPFQLASHQKFDACLFYWHVNLCDAIPHPLPLPTCTPTDPSLLRHLLQVFHFCIYCTILYRIVCAMCVFYK